MKIKTISALCGVVLLNSYSSAETDTFNMSLTGEVTKSYCEISVNRLDGDNTETPLTESSYSMANENDGGQGYYVLGNGWLTLNCSESKEYRITLTTPHSGPLQVGAAKYAFFASMPFGAGFFNASAPLVLETPGVVNTENMSFHFFPTIAPVSGVFNDLPDSFEETLSWIVTIEELEE